MPATKQRDKKKSLASSAAADFFRVSLPASCGALTPSGCVHTASPSPLPAIRLKPSLSSQPRLPRRGSRQASRAAECWSAPILRAGTSPLCPPHLCGCALLRGAKAYPLCHPQSLSAKGLPSVWKPFLLHSSLPLVQVPSLFFCLCYFFFLLPYPSTGGVACLFGGRTFSASVQWVFCRSSSTCRCISTVSVGRKVISVSYSSAIFPNPPKT